MQIPKPLYIILIGALIGVIGSTLPSHSFFIIDTPIKINLISILGAVIASIGAFMQNKSSSRKSDNILQNTIEQLNKTQELANQNLEIIRDVADTSLKLQNSILGGDSFCELFFISILGDPTMLVQHHGSFPLYDLTARIVDNDLPAPTFDLHHPAEPDGFSTLQPHEFEKIKSWLNLQKIVEIGDLSPDTSKTLGISNVRLDREIRSFTIFFLGRNGAYTQSLRMFKQGGTFLRASKITKSGDPSFSFEKVDEHFPLDKLTW